VSPAKIAELIEMPFWVPETMCGYGSRLDESIRIHKGRRVGDVAFCQSTLDTCHILIRNKMSP